MSDDRERIELPVTFTATWLRRAVLVAVALVLVIGGYLVTLIPDEDVSAARGDPDVAGWLAVAFGCCVMIGALRRLLRPAVLRITADGFFDDTSPTAAGFVPWSAVEDVRIDHRGHLLCIRLSDPTILAPLRTPLTRWLRRSNRRFGADVYIPRIVLSTPLEEIAHAMRLARIQSLYDSDS